MNEDKVKEYDKRFGHKLGQVQEFYNMWDFIIKKSTYFNK